MSSMRTPSNTRASIPALAIWSAMRWDSGFRDAAIGHQQHPARPQLAQIETDFVGGAGTELQLRCPVGEYRFGVGGKVVAISSSSGVSHQ